MGEIFDFSVKTNSLSRAALSEDEGDIFNIHYGDILIKYNEVVDPIYDVVPKIKDGTAINLGEAALKDGDVVFADAAEDLMVGKVVEVTNVNNNPTVAGLHTIVARPQIKFSDYYLGYYFNSHYFHKRIKYVAQGTKVFSISKHVLEQLMMEFPKKIEEQKSIVKLLGGLSRDITVQQRKSVSKDEVMNLFLCKSNALVDVDVYANSWEQRKAGDIFRNVSEKNYPSLPVLSATQENGMVYRNESGIDIKYDSKGLVNYKRVQPGQFVIHLRSFQGGFAYSEIEGIASPAYTVIDFKELDSQSPYFWREVFKSVKFIKKLETVTYGIRDGRSISYSDFKSINLYFSTKEEQQKIGKFFELLDHHITFQQRM